MTGPALQPLMHLAHSHLLDGHIRAHNTLNKLWNLFLWPGMDADVQTFCQQYPQCQQTVPQ